MGSNLFMEMLFLSLVSVTFMENGHLNVSALRYSVVHEEVLVGFFSAREDGQKRDSLHMFQKVG